MARPPAKKVYRDPETLSSKEIAELPRTCIDARRRNSNGSGLRQSRSGCRPTDLRPTWKKRSGRFLPRCVPFSPPQSSPQTPTATWGDIADMAGVPPRYIEPHVNRLCTMRLLFFDGSDHRIHPGLYVRRVLVG
jgi:hypothetical protein